LDSAGLTVALALAAGVVAQSLARHARVPGIVVLLFAGALLGPDLLGWIDPQHLGEGLFGIVEFGVAVILFEGGLNLEISRLRREQEAIRRLVTVGSIVTMIGGALAARILLDWDWIPSVLFGSLVVVTGPTVVTPLVRELRLRPRVATVLDAEGVLIDPIGVILAVLVLGIALAPGTETLAAETLGLISRLGFGIAAGSAAGLLLGGMLRVRRLVPEGFENILTLAFVLFLFEGCGHIVSNSGIMAVTVAGVWVGNMRTHVDRDLREFKDQLTVLLIGLLFVLLAADVRLDEVRELGWRGVAVVAALIVAVRPVCVWASTVGSDLPLRERAFLSWMAPRGIVAAAMASLTASVMARNGIEGGAELRALVFLTIAITVVLAGLTALPVASLLGLRLPRREGVAILGSQGLGLALAEELRSAELPVVFLDSNPQHCRRAEELDFPVVFGNALEERTLQRARCERIGTAIGLTPNETLNSMFVAQAREQFGVPSGYVALESNSPGVTPALAQRHNAQVLFERPHDVERWDVRARHGEVESVHLVYGEPEESGEGAQPPQHNERYVLLSHRRGSRVVPMSASIRPRAGDITLAALHAPEREEALASLARLGWTEVSDDEAGAEAAAG
jgi:NhaP-type Na+/H+ or K+/H+ antiporter